MANNYRVHYKKGDVEIEVESTEKDYIDQMLQKLVLLPPKPPDPLGKGKGKAGHKAKLQKESQPVQEEEDQGQSINVAGVVAKIQESDNFDRMDENILKKSTQLPRILLTFHFAHESAHEFITTGDVERITDQLGIKIRKANVGKCIKNNKKYFTAKNVRRRGAIVPYKLTRHGKDAFKNLLAGGEL